MSRSATGPARASWLDPTRLCGSGEAGLAELESPCNGGCTSFFALLCPFVLYLFLGKMGFFFKLGNPRKWKKRREAERGVGAEFFIFILDGKGWVKFRLIVFGLNGVQWVFT